MTTNMAENKEIRGDIPTSEWVISISTNQQLDMIKSVVRSSKTENITGGNGALAKTKAEIIQHLDSTKRKP